MIAKMNELLCVNSEWHRYERRMMICYSATLMIGFVTLALTCYWTLKSQTISNQILYSLTAVEIVFFVLYMFFSRRAIKLCNEFYDKANELADSIYKMECEQACKPWLASWSDSNLKETLQKTARKD